MNAQLKLLFVVFALSGCATTTLYTGTFSAKDSTGAVQPFVIYWNASNPFIGPLKASPVTLLPCKARTIQFEEQPAPAAAGTPTWIVFRGEPGVDQPVPAIPQLGDGLCGRILTKNRLSELAAPKIELTITCEAGPGDEFSTPSPYLQAEVVPYTIEIQARPTKDLLRDTPTRAVCN